MIGDVKWEKSNPDWQGIAMVGDRVNNTGPGVRQSAAYILKTGGFTDGVRVEKLLESLKPNEASSDENKEAPSDLAAE
jgi:hypothetical protein